MLIPSKFSGYQAGIRLYLGGKGGGAPSPDPQIGQALLKQAATGDRLLDFVMKSYDENKPLVQKTEELNNTLTEKQIEAGDTASKRADEAYDFYQTKGKPIVEQELEDAKNWDSEGNLGKAAADAGNDVAQQYDAAQEQQTRALASMGINPNSGKFAELNSQLSAQKALGVAGAQNGAMDARRMQAVGMRANAGNVAQGMPAQVMGYTGGAGTNYGSAANIGNANIGMVRAGQQQVAGGLQAGAGIYGNVAQGYNDLYANQLKGYQAEQASSNGGMSGLGSIFGSVLSAGAKGGALAGMFADGGKIEGPGTGTSDDVPAVNGDTGQKIQLSNGEYIIPADVVRAKGVEFFDKLRERYHTPVHGNLGRA